MRRRRADPTVATPRSGGVAGFRVPPEAITVAVRGYLRCGLPYREVEELPAERGIEMDHVTVYRWGRWFTPLFVEAARPLAARPGGRLVHRRDRCAGRSPVGATCTGRSTSSGRSSTCSRRSLTKSENDAQKQAM